MKRTVLEMLNSASQNDEFKDVDYVSDKTDKGWKSLTFKQVAEHSDCLAISLLKLGLQKNDTVAIISEGRSSWIVSEYAVLKAGGISVPLSVKLQPDELMYRIKHAETKFVVISKNCVSKTLSLAEEMAHLGIGIIYLDNDSDTYESLKHINNRVYLYDNLMEDGRKNREKYAEQLAKSIAAVEENDVVTISYTSGTTGNPKGIMLTQLNYWANAHDALRYFKLKFKSKMFVVLPLDHSFAHTVGFYVATLCGIHISFVDSRGGAINQLKNIPINIKETNPDFMLSVPALTGNFMRKIQDGINAKGGIAKFLFNNGIKAGEKFYGNGYNKPNIFVRMWKYPIYKLADAIVFKKIRKIFGNNFKFFVGGGAQLDIKQQFFFNALGVPVYQGYGLSEASPIISVNTSYAHKFGSSGGVLTGIKAKIVDPDGNELPAGQKGILCIEGLNVMKGYFKNPEATAEVINGTWLNTGDMGYIDKDNFLYVTGREKALLISSDGEKYSPEAMEDAIVNSGDLIYQAVLYNDHCKYTSALVTLDAHRIKDYAKRNNITDPQKMLEAVKKSFFSFTTDGAYKNKFPRQWIPSVFRIIPEPFTEQNQMMNSTMKLVRFKILQNYADVLKSMYTADGKTDCQENIDAIKKLM